MKEESKLKKNELDKETFKEMILFISEQAQNYPTFGSTHLNKVLHYSDFFWYGNTGNSISNETYIREDYGQVPQHLIEARAELIDEGKLFLLEKQYYGKKQKRLAVAAPQSYSRLTEEQKDLIKKVIDALAPFTASEVSEQIAHQDLSWQYLRDREEIPYETVFFRRQNKIPDETMDWAKNVIDEYEESLGRVEGGV